MFKYYYFLKISLFSFFLLGIGFTYAESTENVRINTEKHLVIHVDVNKTIIASDQAGNKTVDNTLNHLLSERYSDFWDDNQLVPMTYRDYIHKLILPGKSSDQELRELRKVYLDNFVNYLNKSNHLLKDEVNQKYIELLNSLSIAKTNIFPSFIKLINTLNNENINYSILLRSFGHDLEDVVSLISSEIPNFHFNERAFFQNGKLQTEQQLITQPAEIYNYINSHGHMVIQDDWSWWTSHDAHKEYGKPFFTNTEDNHTLSLFFDDNIKIDSTNQNILAPYDIGIESTLDIDFLIKENKIIKVDTIKAILDQNYFIDKVLNSIECNTMVEQPPKYLYKVLSLKNWEETDKSVHLSQMDADFVHLSTEKQLDKILKKFWANTTEYVVLKLETALLPGDLVLEANPGGINKYYHLYNGSIPLIAVVETRF